MAKTQTQIPDHFGLCRKSPVDNTSTGIRRDDECPGDQGNIRAHGTDRRRTARRRQRDHPPSAKSKSSSSTAGADIRRHDARPVLSKPTGSREGLIAWLSYVIGGWNASPPTSAGRLRGEPAYESGDDETIVRYLLKEHKESVTCRLTEEIIRLKAKLYDLENSNAHG